MACSEIEQLQERVHRLKDDGIKKVVLDLGGVHLIGSSGVGTLVACYKTLKEAGGDLKLANLSERTHYVLVVIVQIARLVEMFDKAEDAVASFQANGR